MISNDSEQTIEQITWVALPGTQSTTSVHLARFRGTVRLERVPLGAVLSFAASGYYRLYVNGVSYGSGVLAAATNSAQKTEIDLAKALKRGVNIIGIELYSSDVPCHLSAQVKVVTKTGEQVFTADENWLCSQQTGYSQVDCGGAVCEVFEESGKAAGWLAARFKSKDWSPCVVVNDQQVAPEESRLPELLFTTFAPAFAQAFNVPERAKDADLRQSLELAAGSEIALLKAGSAVGLDMVANTEELKVIKTPRGDRGVAVVIDYDVLVNGKFGLKFASAGSGVADIFFAKIQPSDEGVPVADTSLGMMRVNFQKGEFDLRSFIDREFRYVRIEFRRCTQPVEISALNIESCSLAAKNTTAFESNRAALDEKWQEYLKKSTDLLCGIATSRTSQLEINPTLYSAIIYAANNLYADLDFAKYLLGASEQSCENDFEKLSVQLDYFEVSGDKAPLQKAYSGLVGKIEEMWETRNSVGLLEADGKVLSLPNVKLSKALRFMSLAAWICGNEEDAYRYRENAIDMRRVIMEHLYDKKSALMSVGEEGWRMLHECPVDVNLEALQADILDQYQKNRIYHWLTRPINAPDLTPIQIFTLVRQMIADRSYTQALDYVDSILSSDKNNNKQLDSLAFFGTQIVVNGVLGVKNVLGIQGRYSVAPTKLGLKLVNSSIVVREGNLGVGWKNTRNGLMVTLNVPENARADVQIGSDFGSIVKIGNRTLASGFVSLGSGNHRINCYEAQKRKLKPDNSLSPDTPWTKVEVLEGVSQCGIHSRSSRPDRRKRKDDSRQHSQTEEVEQDQMQINDDEEVQEAENITAQSAETDHQNDVETSASKHKRRHHSKKKTVAAEDSTGVRDKSTDNQTDKTQDNIPPPAIEIKEPEHVQPRRRGRARPRHGVEQTVERAVIDVVAAASGEQADSEPKKPQEHQETVKPQRRGRTRRRPEELKVSQAIDVVATVEGESAATKATPEESPTEEHLDQKKRKSHSRRRRPQHKKPQNGQDVSDTAQASVSETKDPGQTPPDKEQSKPSKPRHRRPSRKPKTENSEISDDVG